VSARRLNLVAATALVAGACASPTASCDAAGAVTGHWSYAATQETPVHGTLTGSLVISSQTCTDFQGALDVIERLTTGESRRIAGPVSGSLVDTDVARFEVTLGGVGREHLVRLHGDSMSGSWVETGGSLQGNGRFGGRRQ
jgi:hypothetical protein